MDDLRRDLQKHMDGDVRFDTFSRMLYSTDASIYEIEPLGVVIPRHADDVEAAVGVARQHRVPVLPRGGGTALAGQTVGRAVIMDMSNHMHQVLELNTEEHWAWVQPGVVQDQLNAYLRPHGFLFGPDTSTSSRATIGGMIGNNSAGARSILYGKTIDHVLELKVVLSDASTALFKPMEKAAVEDILRDGTLEAGIYRGVLQIADDNRDAVLERYPKLLRRVSGYNLDEFITDAPVNLAKMVVGSEGTLAAVTAAKVRIMPRPKATAVLVTHFEDMIAAVEATEAILPYEPSAIEMVDRKIVEGARAAKEFHGRLPFLQGEPDALVISEFYGDSEKEVADKVEKLQASLRRENWGYAYSPALTAPAQADVWKMRKAGLGILMGTRDARKPVAFVEDTAVDPARLPDFLRRFRQIIADHDTSAGYYGHSSVGCLHIRPGIDLKNQDGVDKMVDMMKEISDLVVEFGGCMSGEHGDGLARSWLNEKHFGPTLYKAFKDVKRAFDPDNRMNPGKVVDGPAPTENLRHGPAYRAIEFKTNLDFSRDGGFATAIDMCNGNGACRKLSDGTMCPSYMATRDETHSTRGRANALRAVLAGRVPQEEFTGKAMYDTLDLCLECKACKTECPSNVDMAKLKYEMLSQYYARHGTPLRSRIFANIATVNRLGHLFAPLSNRLARHPLARWVQGRIGLAAQRAMPEFASETFSAWFHWPSRPATQRQAGNGRAVSRHHSWNTTSLRFGRAAANLLQAGRLRGSAGGAKMLRPVPRYRRGSLEQAREYARYNIALLAPFARQGVAIVGVEPRLHPDAEGRLPGPWCPVRTRRWWQITPSASTSSCTSCTSAIELDLRFTDAPRRLLLHGHCHQKALVGTGPTMALLRLPPGYEVDEIASGCCGMAGSFGYEAEHYELSMDVGRQRLFPAIEGAGSDVEIVADGISCRQQIQHATGRKARHLAEVLWEAVVPE